MNSIKDHHRQTLIHLPSSPLKPLDLSFQQVFNPTTATLFYEPTSVLDPSLTSSPAVGAGANNDLLLPLPPLLPDDWLEDPVSSWLEEDFVSPTKFSDPDPFSSEFQTIDPEPPSQHQQQHQQLDKSQLDLLFRAADAVEHYDIHSAHAIVARLNPVLSSPTGSPLQRATFYFKAALQSLITPCVAAVPQATAAELVQRVAAYRAFSELSPLPQFVNFTANQAILEAIPSDSPAVHLIDFELGLGGQWSSLTQEIAARSRSARRPPPLVRITAIVHDNEPLHAAEAGLAADNLREFAAYLGLRLTVDLVRIESLGAGVRLTTNESTAAVISPAAFRGPPENSTAVLQFVRRASPRVVVFVNTESSCSDGNSFKRSFINGLEHYAALLESLEASATAAIGGPGEESVRLVEGSVVKPRVEAAVNSWAGPGRLGPWTDFFIASGFIPVQLSEFAESQAEWLLKGSPVEGFHVGKRDTEMVMSWRGKELATTSAWRY